MIKKLSSIVLLSFTLLLASCTEEASNVYTFILDASYTEFVTMGTSADYPPYESPEVIDGVETLVGIDIEIAKRIAIALGKNLRVINRGFDFLIEDLASGKVDFVLAALTPTAARAEVVDFSISYEGEDYIEQVLLIKASDLSAYDSIDVLNNSSYKLGAQQGSIQSDLLAEFFPNATTQVIQSLSDLVLYLDTDTLDGIVMEAIVASAYIQSNATLAIAPFAIPFEGGSSAAVKKGDAALLTVINQVISDLISSGDLATIYAQFE
jgi:arginine/lysine/histidine transporter system substrate-binding protein